MIITDDTTTRTIEVSSPRGAEFAMSFDSAEKFFAAAEILAECKGENGIFLVY